MPLSPTTEALLAACARAMAEGHDSDLNLFPANHDLGFGADREAVTSFMARAVAEASGGKLTAIPVSGSLLRYQVKGPAFYFAVCPAGTDEVGAETPVYMVGPYDRGFRREERAPQPEQRLEQSSSFDF